LSWSLFETWKLQITVKVLDFNLERNIDPTLYTSVFENVGLLKELARILEWFN